MPCDGGEARAYFATLYAGVKAGGGYAGIVGGPLKRSRFDVKRWRAVPDELDDLAKDALRLGENAYTNVNPMMAGVPQGKRGTAEHVVTLVGYVADLDLDVPGHKGDKRRPESPEAVLSILDAAGLPEPTMAVHSGGGIHAYWIFPEAIPLSTDEDRARADAAAEAWHVTLDIAFEAAGYSTPDNVADLPRVLRVPGTVRTKKEAPDPVPVTLLWADRARYTADELASFVPVEVARRAEEDATPRPAAPARARRGIPLDPRGEVVGPELKARIEADWQARLDRHLGPYVTGRRDELMRAAVWAGSREWILGDRVRDELFRAAEAGGTTSRRGIRHVEKLIDPGLELGRADPYKPPALQAGITLPPPARNASSGDELENEDALEDEPAGPDRPSIYVSNRQLREVEERMIRALQRMNGDAPRLFDHGGEVVAVARARMRAIGEAGLSSFASRAADFYRVTPPTTAHPEGRVVAVSPPRDALRALASRDAADLGLPPLDGFSSVPIFRPDGTIVTTPGYDRTTRLFYAPTDGMVVDEVPAEPDRSEVEKARTLLLDTWGEFPYRDEASRAHALAVLVTAVLRPAVLGPVPLAVFTASTPGSGKTKLPETLLAVATGKKTPAVALPGTEEERRKTITSALREDGRTLFFDNVDGTLRSAVLSMLLTASTWSDRVLGSSTQVELPVRAIPVTTGNGTQLRGDLTRRAFYVELDARLARPWLRDGFTHPNLQDHVLANRAELVHAVLVLGRAWVAAGRPAPTCPRLGSYEAWRTLVGGVLEHAGVEGFLANAQERIDDPDVGEWAAFTEALATELDPQFTAAQVAAAITDRPITWRDLVPGVLAGKAGRTDFAKSIGEAFNMRAGRRWDDTGLRLERVGQNRQKVNLWAVVRDHNGPAAGDEVELRDDLFDPWSSPDDDAF